MKASEIKSKINDGALTKYSRLYESVDVQRGRFSQLIDTFISLYGDREAELLSVPGRSEISGNHTDHNRGCVLAGAINRDVIAVAARNCDGVIRIYSEGYEREEILLQDCSNPDNFDKYTSKSLIAGTVGGFELRGYKVGGFDIALTSDVLKGSGISSSAAFEVMIGNALNHLYNEGSIPNPEIAKVAQYAENVYFGKPCGLMDQMACAVGGFVNIDFENPKAPIINKIDFDLSGAGYSLCIVNTGGNHADLNDDYASVPAEMKSVAAFFGKKVLRELDKETVLNNVAALREKVGDRAILRAIHFFNENGRVDVQAEALKNKDTAKFLEYVIKSGNSSYMFLQNVFTTKNVAEQGLSLALCITDSTLSGTGAAWRVHGGGFAGTIQAFVPHAYVEAYRSAIDSAFGKGACHVLRIRPYGAIKV